MHTPRGLLPSAGQENLFEKGRQKNFKAVNTPHINRGQGATLVQRPYDHLGGFPEEGGFPLSPD
eukprot:1139751-Pelagomonas_calceolata.AAC.4